MYLFLLLYFLFFFCLDLTEDASPYMEIVFNNVIVCLIILLCFINVSGNLFFIYFLQLYFLINKCPKFKWIIGYFNKHSLYVVIFNALLDFSLLLILIYIGFYPIIKIF